MSNKLMIGSCGLACMLCSAKLKGECEGCTSNKAENCSIKACCEESKLMGCYECDKYPCEQNMFKNQKVCAFVECAIELGVEGLVTCLKQNNERGIIYHPVDGSKGDYDKLVTKNEIKELIVSRSLNG